MNSLKAVRGYDKMTGKMHICGLKKGSAVSALAAVSELPLEGFLQYIIQGQGAVSEYM